MSNYNSVTPEFIDELKTLLGEKYVKTDADTLDRYKTDEEADERCFHLPDVVVIPANAEEISGVVKLCNKYLVSLTRGGGTGIVDGAIADKGGVVLLMERLNKIIELNKEGLYMVAQAGVCARWIFRQQRRRRICFMQVTRRAATAAKSAATWRQMPAASRQCATV